VAQLGRNADGEILVPGRVPDCYLGVRLDPAGDAEQGGVLVAPATLLHPSVPQPDGTVLYELVTGHPDRASHALRLGILGALPPPRPSGPHVLVAIGKARSWQEPSRRPSCRDEGE
jgi:hypothetical protein